MEKITITGLRKETALLPAPVGDVPLREVRKQLRIELETSLRSNRGRDGFIRDETALYEIACLTKALKLLRGMK